jgi:hypothetical protein
MSSNVINGPFLKKVEKAGFTNFQFKRLDALFLQAASQKVLTYRAVDCDFDEGTAEFSYYKSQNQPHILRFVIRQVGPRTNMYEVWTREKGRIFKSGLFERAYEKLSEEIDLL